MECKVLYCRNKRNVILIGIYPEWNVKSLPAISVLCGLNIGIYPEWNVKPNRKLQGRFCLMIGIYPEWNVKLKLKKDCLISL